MHKIILIVFFITNVFILPGQEKKDIKMKLTLNGMDTLMIEKYDADQNLIFQKDFRNWGDNTIGIWQYSNGRIKSQLQAHSKRGFEKIEYSYDTLNNIIYKYSYIYQGIQKPIANLMEFHSEKSILKMNSYKIFISKSQKVLKSVKYLSEDQIQKEVVLWGIKSKWGILETLDYAYSNKKCTHFRHESRLDGPYDEAFYEYDQDGNETQYLQVYNGIDTTCKIHSNYEDGLLIKQHIERDLEIKSIDSYTYNEGKLVSIKSVSPEGKNIFFKKYVYFPDGRIEYIEEQNVNWEFQMKNKVNNSITYFYYY